MKVVCIDDNFRTEFEAPKLKKGNIYNVIEEKYFEACLFPGYTRKCESGLYYKFFETGIAMFLSSHFIPVNEDQADETEFIREYNREKV